MSQVVGSGTRFRYELAQQLRVDSIRCSAAGGSGHPTSSMSAADLMAVLLDGYLRLDFHDPDSPGNDHLIFSKGHASPLYYAMLKAVGTISDDELLTFRRFGSRLEGHPTPRVPPTDVATGSLGQGLPIGVGLALAARDLDRLPFRTWVLCGDSELAEGSCWEAFQHAGWAHLDNLTVIVDVNRLGQTRETMLGWDLDAYAARIGAFGWHTVLVDGHDLAAVDDALAEVVGTNGRPTAVLARTRKGRGVAAVEDRPGMHGRPLDDPDAAIAELGGLRSLHVEVVGRRGCTRPPRAAADGSDLPSWRVGEEVATRLAYGQVLAALGGQRGDVVALDGEVSNSTYSELFARAHPDRYFEMFIAEQQLVAAAVGMQVLDWVPFASTFAAFLARAQDFVRMAAVSRADLRLVGSHAGVSIGQDGPSQMALEDLAAMRAVSGSTVLHPSDANQVARLVPAMADLRGVSYLRTLRGATPVRTPPDEPVVVGGSRVVRSQGDRDEVTLVACGVTVTEADRAAELLAAEGVAARVVDCYSIKPIDAGTLALAAAETSALVTVEDHAPHGGLGEAVLSALAELPARPPVRVLGVAVLPGSGSPDELRAAAGIDAHGIVRAARELLGAVARR